MVGFRDLHRKNWDRIGILGSGKRKTEKGKSKQTLF
jgi:hypothetical protein